MPTITVNIPQTTFVASGEPNTNYSFYPLLNIGADPNFQNCTGLLKIPLPQLSVPTVDSARLNLAVITKSGTNPSPIVVNRVTSDYDTNTVTYTTQPPFAPTQYHYDVGTADLYTTIHIDITGLVNEWLDGSQNFGIALANSDGISEVQFATNNIGYEPYFPTLTITYTESPFTATGLNFSYAQLANIIEQLILYYPANTMTVFTRGLVAASVTGTPYQLYKSSAGTYGAIFVLTDAGQQEAIPLNAITAVYTGDGTVYNPSITYLPPPEEFTPGFDTNLITSYYEYLPPDTDVTIYAGSNITASGTIYKNEYGLIVLSDAEGNTPIFIPVNNINVVLPVFQTGDLQQTRRSRVLIEPGKQSEDPV